jgi:hypothetical protein
VPLPGKQQPGEVKPARGHRLSQHDHATRRLEFIRSSTQVARRLSREHDVMFEIVSRDMTRRVEKFEESLLRSLPAHGPKPIGVRFRPGWRGG